MSIAEKIHELRIEIMKMHPDAKLCAITLSYEAEMCLVNEVFKTYKDLYASPAFFSQDGQRIKKIFDIEIKREDK